MHDKLRAIYRSLIAFFLQLHRTPVKKGAQPAADGFFHCRLCDKYFEKVNSHLNKKYVVILNHYRTKQGGRKVLLKVLLNYFYQATVVSMLNFVRSLRY